MDILEFVDLWARQWWGYSYHSFVHDIIVDRYYAHYLDAASIDVKFQFGKRWDFEVGEYKRRKNLDRSNAAFFSVVSRLATAGFIDNAAAEKARLEQSKRFIIKKILLPYGRITAEERKQLQMYVDESKVLSL